MWITSIRLTGGFVYLVAIVDGYSRKVLAWRLSNALDTAFCLDCLEETLAWGPPVIFNTDQGSPFTSAAFTGRLAQAGIQISMDGRGWATTSSWNGCGAQSKMRQSIPMPMTRSIRLTKAWAGTSTSTTISVLIRR